MFTQKSYGIDFGTGTIKIFQKGNGVILSERNVVATVGKEKRPVAIGEKAYEMYEKEPPSLHVSFPLQHGVIAHMQDMIALWNYMNEHIVGTKKKSEYYIAVPADITEVEKQAYSQIVFEGEIKPKKVYLIDKPIANAYGLSLDIENSHGICIVDIGADTTEISILSLGGIVVTKLLPYGGNYFDDCIKTYIRKHHNFVIGSKTSEFAKKQIISAMSATGEVKLVGRDVLKGLPGEMVLDASEIAPLVSDTFQEILTEIQSIMEHTPPEILAQIKQDGIYFTGGSSIIPGLAHLIEQTLGVTVNQAQNPVETAVNGLGYLLEHPKTAMNYTLTIR